MKSLLKIVLILHFSVFFNPCIISQNLPSAHYKVQNIQSVLNDIANAYGSVKGIPALRVSKLNNFIAEYDPLAMEIVVSTSFYDFCSGFGKDSMSVLACIIGHELGHYYLDHNYAGGFNEILGENENGSVSLENKKMLEAQADAFGLKYAFFAGYPSYNILPKTIEKMYSYYKISPSKGYPTKEQRISIAKTEAENIKELVYLYQMAVFLHSTNFLKDAETLYSYLLHQDFINSETLNNLGAIKLSQAMDIPDKESKAELFLFPSEIDPGKRFQTIINSRGITKANFEDKENLLTEAERYFRQAQERDHGSAISFINLSGLLVLKGNIKGAQLVLDDMYNSFVTENKFLPANYYLLKGICYTLEQRFEQGFSYLSKAKAKGAYKAEDNLKAFHFFQGLHKLPSPNIEESKVEFVYNYLESTNSVKKTAGAEVLFDLSKGDFDFIALKKTELRNKINYPSSINPFYFSYNDINKGLLKGVLELSNKKLYLIRANQIYSGNTPANISTGDSNKKAISQLGDADVSFIFSNSTSIDVYWDKEQSNTGLFLETNKGLISSVMFFLLAD